MTWAYLSSTYFEYIDIGTLHRHIHHVQASHIHMCFKSRCYVMEMTYVNFWNTYMHVYTSWAHMYRSFTSHIGYFEVY